MESHLLKEIDHVGTYLGEGAQNTPLAHKLADSLRSQIASLLHMSTELASKLKESVLKSRYPDSSQKRILETIEDKLVSHMPVASLPSRKGGGSQKLYSQLPNFQTCDDVHFYKSTSLFEQKQQRLADRLDALGVYNLDEKSHGYCLGLLLLMHFRELPSKHRIHAMLGVW
jgi:hypothetical protein